MSHRIIHIASISIPKQGNKNLYLLQISPDEFKWYFEDKTDTGVFAPTIELAMQTANKKWRHFNFKTVPCGFRYTLPERDEHGINALYYQLAVSHESPNGVYFDEELGHLCFIQNASNHAIMLLKKLGKEVSF